MHRPIVLLTLPMAVAAIHAALAGDQPKFTVSKATTFVTGPLTNDGYVDYAAAVNRRYSRGVTPKNNAAVLYWQAIGPRDDDGDHQVETVPARFFKQMGVSKPPEDGKYFVPISKYLEDVAKFERDGDSWKDAMERFAAATATPWDKEDSPLVADWLLHNEEPLKRIVAGTERPKCFIPLIVPEPEKKGAQTGLFEASCPGVGLLYRFAQALTARAMKSLKAGRTNAAWRDLLACGRLARHAESTATSNGPLIAGAVESVANRAALTLLRRGGLNRKQLAGMLADLKRRPALRSPVDNLDVHWRFVFLDAALMVARDEQGRFFEEFWFANWLKEKLPRESLKVVDWDAVMTRGNLLYDRLDKALREPRPDERLKKLKSLEESLQKNVYQKLRSTLDQADRRPKLKQSAVTELVANILLANLFPHPRVAQEFAYKTAQSSRNLQIAVALAIYRADHGRYPARLDELAPKYLKEIPADAFSTGPLTYQRRGKGYQFYSIGVNRRDDGGRSYEDDPDMDDIGVQMP